MTGAQPDVAWSVQTGIDLDAMLAANAGWIERVRHKTKRDYQHPANRQHQTIQSLKATPKERPMDSKTYNKDLRKTCVKAVFDEFAEHGDMIRPQYAEQWDEIDASRFLGHITGPMDIDVPDLVDVIIDTIVEEAHK